MQHIRSSLFLRAVLLLFWRFLGLHLRFCICLVIALLGRLLLAGKLYLAVLSFVLCSPVPVVIPFCLEPIFILHLFVPIVVPYRFIAIIIVFTTLICVVVFAISITVIILTSSITTITLYRPWWLFLFFILLNYGCFLLYFVHFGHLNLFVFLAFCLSLL